MEGIYVGFSHWVCGNLLWQPQAIMYQELRFLYIKDSFTMTVAESLIFQ
jgi:hypothetical protein